MPDSDGVARLSDASLDELVRASERAQQRAELFRSAANSLATISDALFKAVSNAAPAARHVKGTYVGKAALVLGDARIAFFPFDETAADPWDRDPPEDSWDWDPPGFDVVAHSGLIVLMARDRDGFEGRSHGLWFCDAEQEGRYQWYETAFMFTPATARTTAIRPFMLEPAEEAMNALSSGIAEIQLAWPLGALTIGELDEFIERWTGWFADAANGRLQAPPAMPERPAPRSWRRK